MSAMVVITVGTASISVEDATKTTVTTAPASPRSARPNALSIDTFGSQSDLMKPPGSPSSPRSIAAAQAKLMGSPRAARQTMMHKMAVQALGYGLSQSIPMIDFGGLLTKYFKMGREGAALEASNATVDYLFSRCGGAEATFPVTANDIDQTIEEMDISTNDDLGLAFIMMFLRECANYRNLSHEHPLTYKHGAGVKSGFGRKHCSHCGIKDEDDSYARCQPCHYKLCMRCYESYPCEDVSIRAIEARAALVKMYKCSKACEKFDSMLVTSKPKAELIASLKEDMPKIYEAASGWSYCAPLPTPVKA